MTISSLNARGHEILDETPVSLPVKFNRPEPLHLQIRRMILAETRQQHEGYETFEDADDFAVGDDFEIEDRLTPYEEDFDHVSMDANVTPTTSQTDPAISGSAIENGKKTSDQVAESGNSDKTVSPASES